LHSAYRPASRPGRGWPQIRHDQNAMRCDMERKLHINVRQKKILVPATAGRNHPERYADGQRSRQTKAGGRDPCAGTRRVLLKDQTPDPAGSARLGPNATRSLRGGTVSSGSRHPLQIRSCDAALGRILEDRDLASQPIPKLQREAATGESKLVTEGQRRHSRG
jgi:hypothetical protein